jgi:cobalt-zinc-cadmium efflux system membrane fusion protein
MHVKADVEVASVEARQIVKKSALQEFNGETVVFIRVGDIYEVRMPEFGASDDSFIEVLSGLEEHVEVVTQNSFLIKADILKSGASHEH